MSAGSLVSIISHNCTDSTKYSRGDQGRTQLNCCLLHLIDISNLHLYNEAMTSAGAGVTHRHRYILWKHVEGQ